MRVIIAGGRDYVPTQEDWAFLDAQRLSIPITEVVCGMALGADTFGKDWAISHSIPVAEFPADWKRNGRAAGHMRNARMAKYADVLVAFPGGIGTRNMVKQARKRGLTVHIREASP